MADDNLAAYAERAIADIAEADGAAIKRLLSDRDKLMEQNADAYAKRRAAWDTATATIVDNDAHIAALEAELMTRLPANPIPPARI